jgi:hypothetical protein
MRGLPAALTRSPAGTAVGMPGVRQNLVGRGGEAGQIVNKIGAEGRRIHSNHGEVWRCLEEA